MGLGLDVGKKSGTKVMYGTLLVANEPLKNMAVSYLNVYLQPAYFRGNGISRRKAEVV